MAPLGATLGIWDGHDAGVALIQDGQLVFALSEERLSRVKRCSGFPFLALQRCLSSCGLLPIDVDQIVVAGRYGRFLMRAGDALYRGRSPDRNPLGMASTLMRGLEIGVSRLPGVRGLEHAGSLGVLHSRLANLGFRCPVQFIDHHVAHAWTARLLGLDDAMTVTMDGYGDGLAGTIDAFGSCDEYKSPAYSVALVYGAVTRLLGFGEGEEGKVMGLAATGDPAPLTPFFERIINMGRCDPRLGGFLGRQQLKMSRREDVAAALQGRVEDVVTRFLLASRAGRANLALAGGLFANVSLNGALARHFDRVEVFPHMGDGGLCVGAAASVAGDMSVGLPFWGPSYSEAEMEAALQDAGLRYQRDEAPERHLLDAIEGGRLTARFVGRSEFGPRALGHRSIFLRADRPALADLLNELLGRDDFMPFAPIRRTGAGSSTMTVVVDADDELRRACPTAVHCDGTARTQLVDRHQDAELWAMLGEAESRGLPALINTSFNRHGEPIVETPAHACATFIAAELDVMQLGPYVVRKAA